MNRQLAAGSLPALLGCCVLAATCADKPDLFTPPSLSGTFALAGTVTDAASGAPMVAVSIQVRTAPDDSLPAIAGDSR